MSHPAAQMFRPSLLTPHHRTEYLESAKAAASRSYAAYLALGGLHEPYNDDDMHWHGSESSFVDWVTGFTPQVEAIVATALDMDLVFPGVFLYEVVEEFGKYLRANPSSTQDEYLLELVRLASAFFYRDNDNACRHLEDILCTDLHVVSPS